MSKPNATINTIDPPPFAAWSRAPLAGLALAIVSLAPLTSAPPATIPHAMPLLGATFMHADARTRHAGMVSMRAVRVLPDGSTQAVAPMLGRGADSWTQFVSASSRGPVVQVGHESPRQGGALVTASIDLQNYLVGSGRATQVTGYPGSHYNNAAIAAPGGWLFTSLLASGGQHVIWKPFRGRSVDLTPAAGSFAYGLALSPDGQTLAAHINYQLNLSHREGDSWGPFTRVNTGQVFNFKPQWSPDGRNIAFVAGPYGDHSDIWLCDADGSNPHKLASRNGYSGASPIFSDPSVDCHGGSSDVPCWWGNRIVFTASTDATTTNLYTTDTRGNVEQLTFSPPGTCHEWPAASGQWLAFERRRGNQRDLWVVSPDGVRRRITRNAKGQSVIWPTWGRSNE